MFKRSEVFSVYPNHPTATNLSMAAGGVRLLSWLTLAAAVVNSIFGLPSLITGMSGSVGGEGIAFLLSGLVVIAAVCVIEWVYMKAVMHLNNRQLLSLIRQAEESQERL